MKRILGTTIMLNVIGLGAGGLYMEIANQQEYHLTVISDEAAPLAASVSGNGTAPYFLWTLGIMLLLAAAAICFWYISRCMKYRARYREMLVCAKPGESYPKAGWNLLTLRGLVHDTENRLAEEML